MPRAAATRASVAAPPERRRRRGAELEDAVFDATLRQLAEVGLAGLTMDNVASAAHTGKAALYRRWDNKSDLVLDALRSALPAPSDLEPAGSLREDLVALLSCLLEASRAAHSAAFRAAAVDGNRECRQLLEDRVLRPCRDGIDEAFRRATARGEIPGPVDPLVAALGPAMLVDHVLRHGTASDAFVASVVDRLLLPLTTAPGGRKRPAR